jgi:hypothetical protein
VIARFMSKSRAGKTQATSGSRKRDVCFGSLAEFRIVQSPCPLYPGKRTFAPLDKSVALLIYVMSLMFENVVVFPITQFYVATA